MRARHKLKHPRCWLASLVGAWAIGLGTTFIAFGAVFLWQGVLLPPSAVRTNELWAHTGIFAWVKHWALTGAWVVLYAAALFSGAMTGPAFYRWVTEKYDLLRWKS